MVNLGSLVVRGDPTRTYYLPRHTFARVCETLLVACADVRDSKGKHEIARGDITEIEAIVKTALEKYLQVPIDVLDDDVKLPGPWMTPIFYVLDKRNDR